MEQTFSHNMINAEASADINPFVVVAAHANDESVDIAGNEDTAAIGVTDDQGVDNGETGKIIVGGIAKVTASAAIAMGATVTAAANGKVKTYASAGRKLGFALQAASANGDRILINLCFPA